MGEEFCIVQDDSFHRYVIPTAKEQEWEAMNWEESDGTVPEWAVYVGGSESNVKFPSYRIE